MFIYRSLYSTENCLAFLGRVYSLVPKPFFQLVKSKDNNYVSLGLITRQKHSFIFRHPGPRLDLHTYDARGSNNNKYVTTV